MSVLIKGPPRLQRRWIFAIATAALGYLVPLSTSWPFSVVTTRSAGSAIVYYSGRIFCRDHYLFKFAIRGNPNYSLPIFGFSLFRSPLVLRLNCLATRNAVLQQ